MRGQFWWSSGDLAEIKPQANMHGQPFLNVVPVVMTGLQLRIATRAWYNRDCACQKWTISTFHMCHLLGMLSLEATFVPACWAQGWRLRSSPLLITSLFVWVPHGLPVCVRNGSTQSFNRGTSVSLFGRWQNPTLILRPRHSRRQSNHRAIGERAKTHVWFTTVVCFVRNPPNTLSWGCAIYELYKCMSIANHALMARSLYMSVFVRGVWQCCGFWRHLDP